MPPRRRGKGDRVGPEHRLPAERGDDGGRRRAGGGDPDEPLVGGHRRVGAGGAEVSRVTDGDGSDAVHGGDLDRDLHRSL